MQEKVVMDNKILKLIRIYLFVINTYIEGSKNVQF